MTDIELSSEDAALSNDKGRRDVLREAGIEYLPGFGYQAIVQEDEVIVRRADVEGLIAERDAARAQYEVEHAHRLEDLEDNFRLDDELAIARRELEEARLAAYKAEQRVFDRDCRLRALNADMTPAGQNAPSDWEAECRRILAALCGEDSTTIERVTRRALDLRRAAGVSGEVPASGAIERKLTREENAEFDAVIAERFASPSPVSGSPDESAPCPHCPHYLTRTEWDAHLEREHSDEPSVPFDVMATWYYSTDKKQSRMTKRQIVRLYLYGDARHTPRRHSNGDTK